MIRNAFRVADGSWALAILLVLFLTAATLYNLSTPLYESPDELQHTAYVVWLADGRGLPVVDPADPDGTKAIQNRIKAAVNSRAIKNLKVRATVEYEMTDLPFANVGGLCEPALGDTISPIGDAPSIYYFQRPRTGNGSNRPSGAIRGNLNVSYRFSPRFSFTGYFGLADEENTELVSYEWEKTALTPGAMAYFIPTDKVTLSGGVSYSKIESNAKICVPVMDG